MRICLSVPSLDPSDGGPPVVVQELSLALAELGHVVNILTRKSHSADTERTYLPRHPLIQFQQDAVSTFHPENRSQDTSASVVHDFGLWLPFHHLRARACRKYRIPYINSPCGMLAPWALAHKPWKKRLAWWLYQARDLHNATALVAASPREHRQIRRLFPHKPIAIIPHGVRLPPPHAIRRALIDRQSDPRPKPRTLLFLGRLHPVKGLSNLIHAWHALRPHGWQCILAGPDEASHKNELQQLLQHLNCATDFEFPDLVPQHAKWDLLLQADLFVLPSLSENFGLAVAEAMAAGLPVITTTATPWTNLHDQRCGWVVPASVEHLHSALQNAIALTESERLAMGARGRKLIEQHYSWDAIARDLLELYNWLQNREPQPQPRSLHFLDH